MNDLLIQTVLTNIMTVILSLFSELYFLSAFFERKETSRFTNLTVYLTTSLLFFVSLQFIENRALNLLILALCTVLVTVTVSTYWGNRILFTLLFLAFSSVSEFIVALITQLIFSIEFSQLREGNIYLVGMLLSKFLSLVVFAVLHIVKHHSLTGKRSKYWGILFLLPITTLLTAFVLVMPLMNSVTDDQTKGFSLIVMIGLIICNLYVFRFIDVICHSARPCCCPIECPNTPQTDLFGDKLYTEKIHETSCKNRPKVL